MRVSPAPPSVHMQGVYRGRLAGQSHITHPTHTHLRSGGGRHSDQGQMSIPSDSNALPSRGSKPSGVAGHCTCSSSPAVSHHRILPNEGGGGGTRGQEGAPLKHPETVSQSMVLGEGRRGWGMSFKNVACWWTLRERRPFCSCETLPRLKLMLT